MLYITYTQLLNISSHLEELENSEPRMKKNATLLWETHTKIFAEWIQKKVSLISNIFLFDYQYYYKVYMLNKICCRYLLPPTIMMTC